MRYAGSGAGAKTSGTIRMGERERERERERVLFPNLFFNANRSLPKKNW